VKVCPCEATIFGLGQTSLSMNARGLLSEAGLRKKALAEARHTKKMTAVLIVSLEENF